MSEKEKINEQTMPFGSAMFCLGFLLVSMIASVIWLNIPTHINLIASIAVTLLVAWFNNGRDWKQLADAIDYGGKNMYTAYYNNDADWSPYSCLDSVRHSADDNLLRP